MTFGLHHLFITGVLGTLVGFALGIAHARALRNLRVIMQGEDDQKSARQ